MDTPSNYTETLEKTVRDLLKRQEDLVRTAFTDQLTGLGNRGGFARSLEELWEQDTPVTMASSISTISSTATTSLAMTRATAIFCR